MKSKQTKKVKGRLTKDGKFSITAESNDRAKRRMAHIFPAASPSDMIKAKNDIIKSRGERPKIEYYSTDSKGIIRKVDAPPKDQFFREASLRHKHVTPKRKVIKFRDELWSQLTLSNFFRREEIHADDTNGWSIFFTDPARKMTVADQLVIMLAHSETEYSVHVNYVEGHMIIDELNP